MSEIQYLNLLENTLIHGEERPDRTGVGTKSLFGEQIKFDLRKGFPLLTTKKMFWKGIVHELLWIISGDTNIQYLKDNNVNIWDNWADENGDLGPLYGHQLRNWGEKNIDQLDNLVYNLKNNPYSRSHVITTWNVSELQHMTLPPCHGVATQFYVTKDGFLDCKMYQRSADAFIGVPFNIASYSLLTHIIGFLVDKKPRYFIHSFGDFHIYLNHINNVKMQLKRTPYRFPTIDIPDAGQNRIDDFEFKHFILNNYQYHPTIKAEVAV